MVVELSVGAVVRMDAWAGAAGVVVGVVDARLTLGASVALWASETPSGVDTASGVESREEL